MRQILLPFAALFFILFGLNGCTETIIINNGIPEASVEWDFWAGARSVEVDGEIYNDGNTYIESVELEVLMYDERGHYITSIFQTFGVGMSRYDSFIFSLDIREREVYDVEVRIQRMW